MYVNPIRLSTLNTHSFQYLYADPSILGRNLVKIIQHLNIDLIRPHLRQERVITEDEYLRLLDLPERPSSKPIEHLIHMVERKGTHGIRKFISILQKTASKDVAHQEIITVLKQDPDYTRIRNMPPLQSEVRSVLHYST